MSNNAQVGKKTIGRVKSHLNWASIHIIEKTQAAAKRATYKLSGKQSKVKPDVHRTKDQRNRKKNMKRSQKQSESKLQINFYKKFLHHKEQRTEEPVMRITNKSKWTQRIQKMALLKMLLLAEEQREKKPLKTRTKNSTGSCFLLINLVLGKF